MYQDLLGRSPDDAGVSYWTGRLTAGAQPADIAWGFAGSAEREGQRIRALYQTLLGRDPGQSEVDYWVGAFLQGAPSEDVAAGFVSSTEYYQIPGKGNRNPRDWIRAVYRDELHREATDADIGYWTLRLS